MMAMAVILSFLLPLAGTLILAFSGGRLGALASSVVGVGSVGLASLATAWATMAHAGGSEGITLWTWIAVGDFQPTIGLAVDGLALVMMSVITGVGFLIHLFAAWYMTGEEGITRFYAWMNLFVFSMMLLVLGDNLLLLFLGWEGVGLCSYGLIGYYYQGSANGWAAFKAFVVTRIGDVFLALGLFLIFMELGTLDIQQLLALAPQQWQEGSATANLAALLVLGGALGKSAQVSLLLAAFAALAQTDIKRVLAYSTMSQIGYMFVALGVGAFDAAIFHLVTHAFFKALLFLSAGAVIISCHHEQDMRRLGGLWRKLPVAYGGFLVGGAALVALPLVSAGFFSKDEILWQAMAADQTGLLIVGLLGAVLTGIYTVRLILGTFHGEPGSDHARHPEPGTNPLTHHLPLMVLAVLSTFIGAWLYPGLGGLFPDAPGEAADTGHTLLQVLAMGAAIAGLLLAAWLFLWRRDWLAKQVGQGIGARLWTLWHHAWGFDALFDRVLVQPWQWMVKVLRVDLVNLVMNLPALLARALNAGLVKSQNGRVRSYALVMVLGATIILLALAVLPGGLA